MSAAVDKPPVDVVMATYNGARYLPQMLASLVAQQWPSLRLIVCDDGSTDGTIEILESFRDIPVKLVRNPVNLGARENFSQALRLAEAGYVALADQDDVWMPDKIRLMVERLQQLEAVEGREIPVLAYSDLHLVDGELRLISPSFYDGTFKSREATTVQDFAISNHVPGCAVALNRALIDAALPVPADAQMHDWWLCIVAAALGHIGHVEQPLIQFRRHGANETGSGRPKDRSDWIRKALGRATRPRDYFLQRMEDTAKLATGANARLLALELRYHDRLSSAARHSLDDLMSPRWWRRYAAVRTAHSGESPITDLLVTLQMGRPANRPSARA